MAERERNSYDLKTLAHVMEDSAGIPEHVDRSPVLRSDIIDGLQRYLAAQAKAHEVLQASGYFELLADAKAILEDNPEHGVFVSAMHAGKDVVAFDIATTRR